MDARWRAERSRRIRRWILAILIAGITTATGNARAAELPSSPPPAVPGQALIRFRPGTADPLKLLIHARAGAVPIREIPAIDYDLVAVPGSIPSALRAYRSDPNVAVAEPNLTGSIALSPTDACHATPCDGLASQWHHRMTNTALGWSAFPGRTYAAGDTRPPVTIAVLDTKIDVAHRDWVPAGGSSTDAASGGQLDLANARDWVPADRQNGWALYHGTFVAGLAAAATGNARDAAGVGYLARVLPLTVVDGNGVTNAADLADAIVYAWQRGARVINLSLGISGDSQAVRDAIKTVTAGTTSRPASLVVAAAGNNTGSAAFYPGSYPESMSVSGTDASDKRATCSNYNANVSVSAPADRLWGLSYGGVVQAPCGTSAATPQVSGLAGLLFAQNAARTPAQVRSIIERSADDLGPAGRDDTFGHGRINVERALRTAGPKTTNAAGSVVGAAGGTATITAVASGTAVRAAQVIFDRPDAAPVTLRARDGAFGGSTEQLVGEVRVPAGLSAGPHPIWVRASDGTTWGPASVGVVAVDGRAPTIANAAATNAVRAAGQPLTISFDVADDYSARFSHGVEVRSTATNAVVFRATRFDTAGGRIVYQWTPGLDILGGHYKIKLAAADQAGNIATIELGALVA